MPSHSTDGLDLLARLYGVRTTYRDVFGSRRRAAPDAVIEILRALGAPLQGPDDIGAALRHRRQQLWRRLCPPVLASRPPAAPPPPLTLRLAAEAADGPFDLSLTLEDGEQRAWRATLEGMRVLRRVEVESQSFVELTLPLPATAPGYHRLRVEAPGVSQDVALVVAPDVASEPDRRRPDARRCGVFLPLYALRPTGGHGVGDLGDLEMLAEWAAELGVGAVAVLPLLAIEPRHPSPYSPLSRLMWSELHVDLERVPELALSRRARRRLASEDFQRTCRELRRPDLVDHAAVARLLHPVLRDLAMAFFATDHGGARRVAFDRFLERRPDVRRYALWRALADRHGCDWRRWPTPARDGSPAAEQFDPGVRDLHLYSQFLVASQLEELAAACEARGVGLGLDLPLGTPVDSFDVWDRPRSFALSACAGAPPDTFFRRGQNWGLPPLVPAASRQSGHRYLVQCLRHHLRVGETLRIDHVMALERLFWIPDGFEPVDGAYVHYPADELFAIAGLEASRHGAAIVGEDLGTVPPTVRRRLREHGMLSCWVLQAELPASGHGKPAAAGASEAPATGGGPPVPAAGRGPAAPRERVAPRGLHRGVPVPVPQPHHAASVNTHDMPPFAAWWQGLDLDDLEALGHLDRSEAEEERKARRRRRAALLRTLRAAGLLGDAAGEPAPVDSGSIDLDADSRDLDADSIDAVDPGDVLRASLEWLAASSAADVIVSLEDLWLETRPQNVPGTLDERPNWRRRARLTIDEMRRSPGVAGTLRRLVSLRREATA